MSPEVLKVTDLVKLYPAPGKARLHAVDGVSFAVAEGECLGLVGESGCGKSTLSRLIARLIDPTSGAISLCGRDIGLVPAARFTASPDRRDIQMVFQDPGGSLNPRYSVLDAVADPLRRMFSLGQEEVRERVSEAARMTGLPQELLGRFPHQLSGGQLARVGIARALACRPKLLIADEPTSALDVSVQAVILKLLDDLRRQLSMSCLFISHDLNVVRLFCDRVMVMYLGQVVEQGPAADIFERPLHPYTAALIRAIPRPGRRGAPSLLPGEPQSPIDPDPHVCRFAGRCPREIGPCRAEAPQTRDLGGGRFVACHLHAPGRERENAHAYVMEEI